MSEGYPNMSPTSASSEGAGAFRVNDEVVKVGYWRIRGLVAPLHMLAAVLGVPTEAVHYEQGDGPEFSRSAWLSVKDTLGLPAPNLPFIIDGSVRITQSQTCLRYLARRYGAGSGVYEGTAAHLAQVDELMDAVIDARQAFTRWCYSGAPGSAAAFFGTTLPPLLAQLAALTSAAGGPFAIGASLTLADFPLAELLAGVSCASSELLGADCLAGTALAGYLERFQAEPRIRKFMASPGFLARPFNNKVRRAGAGGGGAAVCFAGGGPGPAVTALSVRRESIRAPLLNSPAGGAVEVEKRVR